MPPRPEALRAAYDAATAEGYAHIMMNCRVYLGNCCSDSGDPKRMQQHYAVAQRLAEALGDQKILSTIRYNDAATKIECGDFAAAYAYFSALEETDAMSLHKLAVCCEALGRRDEALAALARAEEMLPEGEAHAPERQMLALVRCRLETPDYLHDERYGELLTNCFALLRRERRRGLRALPPQVDARMVQGEPPLPGSLRAAGGLSCGKVKKGY